MFVHWANGMNYLEGSQWQTEALPASKDRMQWMFCAPANIDNAHGTDLIAAGKNAGAQVGWFESPSTARNLAVWKWHALHPVGWAMSILPVDMDNDGDNDILFSDRKDAGSGCYWLENPFPNLNAKWRLHTIGAQGREVMFLVYKDLDGDAVPEVVIATKPREILIIRKSLKGEWQTSAVSLPQTAGNAKSVDVGDINLDHKADLVFACEGANGMRSGVMALLAPDWQPLDISGTDGTKFDLIQLLDADSDGDLDVFTCEEAENLGVVWYENPTRN
jgi:hypothetical protein